MLLSLQFCYPQHACVSWVYSTPSSDLPGWCSITMVTLTSLHLYNNSGFTFHFIQWPFRPFSNSNPDRHGLATVALWNHGRKIQDSLNIENFMSPKPIVNDTILSMTPSLSSRSEKTLTSSISYRSFCMWSWCSFLVYLLSRAPFLLFQWGARDFYLAAHKAN